MELSNLLAIFVAMLMLAAIPGPAVLAVSACAVSHGMPRAAMMIVGITLGDYLYIVLALFGLSALAYVLGEAFIYVKYLSAAYIFYIGYSLVRSNGNSAALSRIVATKKRAVLGGLMLNLSNPKAIVFYFGFFPAFIEPDSATIADLFSIMLAATVAFASVNLIYANLAIKAKSIIGLTRNGKTGKVVVGIVLMAAASWLVLSGIF